MAAEGDARLIDDPLVHRACHHGGEFAAQVAVAGALQGGQHIGAIALVELARHHGGAERDGTHRQGSRPLTPHGGGGIIGFQLDGQPQQGGALAQQRRVGDHHQLVRPVPLGYLQHQVRAYAGGLTRGDGKTMAVHLLIAH